MRALNGQLANPFRVEGLENDVAYPGCYATTPRGLPARGPRSGLELANAFGLTAFDPDLSFKNELDPLPLPVP